MTERNLKLEHLTKIRLLKPLALNTNELAEIAAAFVDNATRVKALSLFPLLSMLVANMKERVAGAAFMSVMGDLTRDNLSQDQHRQYAATQQAMWSAVTKSQTKQKTSQGMADSIRHLQSQVQDDRILAGIEAWLSAQIVGAWTAFETLTGDLWEAALNCHPAGLSELNGKKSSVESERGKSVPLTMLQKYKYDLSASMGTILKENRSFDRLSNIREFYAEAFFDDAQKIEKILANKSIDVLSAVRNLIVHRASVVDQKYLNRIKSLPNAPKANIGTKIMLDGQTVAELIQPVMQLGCELILAVDSWITLHH